MYALIYSICKIFNLFMYLCLHIYILIYLYLYLYLYVCIYGSFVFNKQFLASHELNIMTSTIKRSIHSFTCNKIYSSHGAALSGSSVNSAIKTYLIMCKDTCNYKKECENMPYRKIYTEV